MFVASRPMSGLDGLKCRVRLDSSFLLGRIKNSLVRGRMKINLTNRFLLSLFIWAAPAAVAQSSNCDYGYLYQTYEGIPLTPGTYRCDPFLPYTMSCSVKTTACRPPRAGEETSCKSCAVAGSPINLASGNTYII